MALMRAAKTDELPVGSVREFQVEGKTLAIANVDGKFYAINNTCLHRGGPLGQGELQGKILTCPWHGWQYDVTTGKLTMNAAAGVECYALEVKGEDIWVDLSVTC
jgi:nitrite reductase/ring-hydroxylating ferredoxin subunit